MWLSDNWCSEMVEATWRFGDDGQSGGSLGTSVLKKVDKCGRVRMVGLELFWECKRTGEEKNIAYPS